MEPGTDGTYPIFPARHFSEKLVNVPSVPIFAPCSHRRECPVFENREGGGSRFRSGTSKTKVGQPAQPPKN